MKCPKCEGPMWDNTLTPKRNPKGPDHKCKDKSCNHAVWLGEGYKPSSNNSFDESMSVLQKTPKKDFPKSMTYAFIKDMIVANINKGVPLDELEKTTKEQVKTWVLIGDEVDNWNNGVK